MTLPFKFENKLKLICVFFITYINMCVYTFFPCLHHSVKYLEPINCSNIRLKLMTTVTRNNTRCKRYVGTNKQTCLQCNMNCYSKLKQINIRTNNKIKKRMCYLRKSIILLSSRGANVHNDIVVFLSWEIVSS